MFESIVPNRDARATDQVKDWGTGKPADLGSLEVDSVTTVSGDPLSGDSDRPFYEQLARHLEICQVGNSASWMDGLT